MKIKFKCTPSQYGELVTVIGKLPYDRIAITNIELINLKHFWFDGKNKMSEYVFHKKPMHRVKQFTIDVNHYEAIKSVLSDSGSIVSQHTISIVETIKQYAEPQILQQVSGYKLVG